MEQDIITRAMFTKLREDQPIRVAIRWLIDSNYKKKVELDSFLRDQIINPEPCVQELANQFKKYAYDTRIVMIQNYVYEHWKYKSDSSNYGALEYWAQAAQTLKRRSGDCDDMNSLIYVLAVLSGIHPHLLYCCIGMTSAGGHFWVIYWWSDRDRFCVIDSTYKVNKSGLSSTKFFEFTEESYQAVWYYFNQNGVYK